MLPLHQALEQTPRRRLLVIARQLGLRPDSLASKADLIARLEAALPDPATLARCLDGLSPDALEALTALLVAGGAWPRQIFLRRFGHLRPYRPWRADSPHHPWRDPVSPVETLWYLGLIYSATVATDRGPEERLVIPLELLPHLRRLVPLPTPSPLSPPTLAPGDLDRDVAALLALAHQSAQGAIRLHNRRWLPPRLLRALNARLTVPEPGPLRSELQTTRPRFIHFLTRAAHLVAAANGQLELTPAGWLWLNAPPAKRWQALWTAFVTDDAALWTRFRLPGHATGQPLRLRDALLGHLEECEGQFTLADSYHALLERLPDLVALTPWWEAETGADRLYEILAALFTGPLALLSAVVAESDPDAFSLTDPGHWLIGQTKPPPPFPAPQPWTLTADLNVTVPRVVNPAALARLETWTEPPDPAPDRSHWAYSLTLESVARALGRGLGLDDLYHLLAEGTGVPLPEEAFARLARWAKESTRLKLRQRTLLEAADPALLDELRRQPTIRRRLGEPFGPRAVAVDPLAVPTLRRALRRQGYVLNITPSDPADTPPRSPTDAAYLWIATRLLLYLADQLPLPMRPPAALLAALEAGMDPNQRDSAETALGHVREALQNALAGWAPHPHPASHSDPQAWLEILQTAIEGAQDVEITYLAPAREAPTRRRVTPYRISWRGDVPYLEGYCHLRQSERVFRLDRIMELALSDQSSA